MDFKKAYLKVTNRARYLHYKTMLKDLGAYLQWDSSGRPLPPPHIVKQLSVRENAELFGISCLIETGTYKGDMALAMSKYFSKVFTIELSEELFKKATKRLAKFKNITVMPGDSSIVLKEVLPKLTNPCLFWLDGHYSEGNTARGEIDTPILNELRLIFTHSIRDHLVLIDDARLFNGAGDYPTRNQLSEYISTLDKSISFREYDDAFFVCRSNHSWISSNNGNFHDLLKKELAKT